MKANEIEREYDKICFKENLDGNHQFEETSNEKIFKGLSEEGAFIWRKGIYCNELFSLLPSTWNRMPE